MMGRDLSSELLLVTKRKMSFKNMLNNNEGKIESCGNPAKLLVHSLNDPFSIVFWNLLHRELCIDFREHVEKPKVSNLACSKL